MKIKIFQKLKTNFKLFLATGVVTVGLLGFLSTYNAQSSENGNLVDRYAIANAISNPDIVKVNAISFVKRKAKFPKRGNNLVIDYTMQNRTNFTLNLKVVTVAYNEKDDVDLQYRKYVTYPKWRRKDIDKGKKRVFHFGGCPAIDKQKVFDFVDANSMVQYSNMYRGEIKSSTHKSKLEHLNPASIDYFQYINENINSLATEPILVYSLYEKSSTTEKGQEIEKGNHSILTNGDTAFVSCTIFLKNEYNKDLFFNHVGIFVYDVENNTMLYRKLFQIKVK